MTAQQKDIGSPPSSPLKVTREHRGSPTPRLLGKLLCDYRQSRSIVEFDLAGTGDCRWVHSRPARRVVATVG